MDTPQTCGRGLAEHSPLPIKLAELTDSVRAVLELHMSALDLSDPASVFAFVNLERNVAALLAHRLEQDEQRLASMRAAVG